MSLAMARASLPSRRWVLSGTKCVVVGAPSATRLIVSAAAPQGASLFLVDPAAAPVVIEKARADEIPVVFYNKEPSAADLASAQYIARDGLADANCLSFESVGSPGRWLRHAAYRLQLGTPDNSALFNNDATFCPEAGSSAGSVKLRSKNFPTYLLRQRTAQLWIDPEETTTAFASDASFVPRLYSTATPLPVIGAQTAPPAASGSTVSYAPGLDASGLSFSWN